MVGLRDSTWKAGRVIGCVAQVSQETKASSLTGLRQCMMQSLMCRVGQAKAGKRPLFLMAQLACISVMAADGWHLPRPAQELGL